MARSRYNQKAMNGAWFVIILAISGSGLSMLAIGILLVHYHGKPIFDWNGLTLNAIVAVFSAMSKAMLAYVLSESLGQAKWIWFSSQHRPLNDIDLIDSGSRGPLGSLRIMTQPIARSFISMGAMIVILSAVIDPFIQFSIGKTESLKFDNSSYAQIAYAKRYSKELQDDSKDGALAPQADLRMQSAVSDGLFQSDSWVSQQIQHSCPSGNCTWDTFTSLAICSGCNDLTNRIKKIKGTIRYFGQLHMYEYYRLPNHVPGGNFDTPMVAYGTAKRHNTVSFTSFDTLIWSMTITNLSMKEQHTSSGNLSAIECGLWFCVNSYKSTVKNGKVTETIQPVSSQREVKSWQPFRKGENDTGVAALSRGTLHRLRGTYNGSEPFWTVRRTDLQLGAGFNVSQGAGLSIVNLLHDTFTIPAPMNAHKDLMNAVLSKSLGPSNGPINYDPPAMQSLYESKDLAATFATLAKSMTNNIRQNGQTVISGKEGKYVVLIRVRGWFLILPIILIVAGAVFLTMILYYTRRSGIEFWGTNALPLVALGEKTRTVFDDENMKVSTMMKEAKRHLIQYPTFQTSPDLNRADTLRRVENHLENHETASSPRTSATQSSSADSERIMTISPTSAAQRFPAGMESISPSPRILVPQSPSDDAGSIVSPLRTSVIYSPSADAENNVSPIRASEISVPPADMEGHRISPS